MRELRVTSAMTSPEPGLEELVPLVRARRRRDVDVTEAYAAHSEELYSFLLHATRDPEAARDLLQDSFLKLVTECRSGRTPLNVRAWLYRVAANLVVSRGRRLNVAARYIGRLVNPGAAVAADKAVLRAEGDGELHAVLAGLPVASRAALLMSAHGFSGAEIAAALGRSAGATRTLLARSRVRLRELLEEREVTL